MRSVLRATAFILLVLLIPIVPFLFFGESLERQIMNVVQADLTARTQFLLVVGILATDIFLPVPASAVTTYGGGVLGTATATLASWIGMTIGAGLGFWLAKVFGRPFAARFARAGDLERMEAFTHRFGPLAIVLMRALPILAEASVLLTGATQLSWKRFLPPVIVCNFVISLTYAACGEYFNAQDALPLAVVTSGTIPLGIALFLRKWLPGLNLESSDGAEI